MPSICKSSTCNEAVCKSSEYCPTHCVCSQLESGKTHCSVIGCGDTMHDSDYRRCALHCDKKNHGHCIISSSDLDHFQNLDSQAYNALKEDVVRTQGKYCTSTSVVGDTNLCPFHIKENIGFLVKLKEFYDTNTQTDDKKFIWTKLTKKYPHLYDPATNTVSSFETIMGTKEDIYDQEESKAGPAEEFVF